MQYTQDQVLQLAPDDASAKAGQQLAVSAKWVTKSQHNKALWGECQGSGKIPYKTIIDLANIAFKCTCPSRKFPCKHGLGLMLLYVQQPNAFAAESELPAHISEWLGKREEKEVTKGLKEEKPVDEAGRAKRAESREKKVTAGIEELRYWIKDVVRTGIMNVPQNPYQFSQNITARMVDAQAGGLANQLRQINKINFYKDGWQRQLLKRLSSIYLITEAYSNAAQLPEDMTKELQTLIGWTTPKEDVLQQEPITDLWVVLSVITTDEGNIRTERIWLYGKATMRFALLLNFYAGNQVAQQLFLAGMHIKANVVFFPGVQQLRALVENYELMQNVVVSIPSTYDIDALYNAITVQLSRNPFIEQMPFLLYSVQLVFLDNNWAIRDTNHRGFVVANPPDTCWQLLAVTKGLPSTCFGIYENEQFYIHTLWLNDKI